MYGGYANLLMENRREQSDPYKVQKSDLTIVEKLPVRVFCNFISDHCLQSLCSVLEKACVRFLQDPVRVRGGSKDFSDRCCICDMLGNVG